MTPEAIRARAAELDGLVDRARDAAVVLGAVARADRDLLTARRDEVRAKRDAQAAALGVVRADMGGAVDRLDEAEMALLAAEEAQAVTMLEAFDRKLRGLETRIRAAVHDGDRAKLNHRDEAVGRAARALRLVADVIEFTSSIAPSIGEVIGGPGDRVAFGWSVEAGQLVTAFGELGKWAHPDTAGLFVAHVERSLAESGAARHLEVLVNRVELLEAQGLVAVAG